MSAQAIKPAFTIFQDIDGQPLENGYIYVGTAGLPSATNQITVYSDSALTTALTQPIRTRGGYPVVAGVPVVIYTGVVDYSLQVSDKNNSSIYAALNVKNGFNAGLTGSVNRTIANKLADTVSVKDFGAVGDGVTDDTGAINLAIAASDSVFFPAGAYLTSGGHNISGVTIRGSSRDDAIISLSGSNTNGSIFTNNGSVSTPWGTGGEFGLSDITLNGNWDGSTSNTETTIAAIGGLVKWWSGAYVRITNCNISNSFGYGIFCHLLGYSWVSDSHIFTCAKNGIHWQGINGTNAITSSAINNCSVNTIRGRAVDTANGGNGIFLQECFAATVSDTTIEDTSDGIRIEGADNRSICLMENHIEQSTTSDVTYSGTGQGLNLVSNVFATTAPTNGNFYRTLPEFQIYSATGNFGLADQINLPYATGAVATVVIDNATPQRTIHSITLGEGTWLIQAGWTGTASAGTGIASDYQIYTLNTSAALPGYSGSFDVGVVGGDVVSPANTFVPLQGTLAVIKTFTAASNTIYLFGGPSTISSTLAAVLTGYIKAVKINYSYPV